MNSRILPPPTGTTRTPRNGGTARLQLTSLVDMMVILVVFLLMSFSVEGQLVTPAADLDLPLSSAEQQARPGLTIAVGRDAVRIEGASPVPTAGLAAGDMAARNALAAALTALADHHASPAVTIHCDRRVEFRTLGRILRACGRAGLKDVSLLVLEATS